MISELVGTLQKASAKLDQNCRSCSKAKFTDTYHTTFSFSLFQNRIWQNTMNMELVCFYSWCPSQQFFSLVRTGLQGLNQPTKQQIKCLAQGDNIVTPSAVRLELETLRSPIEHSTNWATALRNMNMEKYPWIWKNTNEYGKIPMNMEKSHANQLKDIKSLVYLQV